MAEKTDHERISEIHSLLLGLNGEPGFCEQIRAQLKNHDKRIRIIELALMAISVIAAGGYGFLQIVR